MKRSFPLSLNAQRRWVGSRFPASAWLATALVVLSGPAVAAQTLLNGLAARWDFEEGAGPTAYDSSGVNANHGTLGNYSGDNSQWVQGKFGGGLAFNGQTGNRLVVPDHPSIAGNLVNAFSVSAWFKSAVPIPGTGSSTMSLLEKGNMFFLIQGLAVNGGGMNLLIKKGGANLVAGIGEDVQADTWYHVAGVFDGAEARVYLNGELKGSLPVAAPMDVTTLPLVIGGDDATRTFNGTIDQVLIWNRALSEEEIGQVVAGNLPPPAGGPPTITTPPQPVSRFAGATARFSVSASGSAPLRYLWYHGDEPLRSETQSTLVLQNLAPSDAGAYKVRVSNDAGEVFSQAAQLTVVPVEGLATGRALYLSLNESTGLRANDGSGNGNHGDLLDFADTTSHWGPGAVQGSLGFDGQAARVAIPDSTSLNAIGDEVSFAFWINPAGYGIEESAGSYVRSASYLLRKGDHFGIKVIDDVGSVVKTLTVRAGAGADSGAVPRQGWEVNAPQNSIELNQWQHFAIVYRNGAITFYKNGFRLGEPVAGNLGIPGTAVLSLGNYDDLPTTARPLNGRLDELGIWARPLSEAEILELAGKDVAGPPQIARQPAGQKRLEGATASFEVFVTGKRPLSYQWLHDDAEIPGATANTLAVTRLKPSDAGTYRVRVTNAAGTALSDPAVLQVEALDAITSGLVAYYPFDDASGNTLTDASGNHLNGQLENMDAASHVAGRIGGAFWFDGIDDHVIIAHDPLLNLVNEATVSVWLRIDGLSNGDDFDRVFRKTTNFDFVLINNGVLRVHGINKDPYSSPNGGWEIGPWTHFAYVFKDNTVQWYRNGEPLGAPINGKLGELATDPLVIGNFSPGSGTPRFYLGAMDDFGIWQRALSAADLFGIYQNGLQGKPLNQEFEPLNIRDLTVSSGVAKLRFYSPFTGRELVVEQATSLAPLSWTAQAGVTLTDQGGGLYLASFPAPSQSPAFYRVAAVPPPPLFAEDFEGNAAGWTHGGAEDNWQHGVPTTGPGNANSGTKVYATGLAENLHPYTDSWLHSPAIDLTGVTSATLRFAEWRALDPNPAFHMAIVNVLDAASQTPIAEVFLESGATGGWVQRTIRLPGDALGRRILLEFRVITDEFNLLPGWFLDDVSVTAE